MMKRTPKTRTATTRQLTQQLEAVKGGLLVVKWPYPTRYPLDPKNSDDDQDSPERPVP